MECSSGTTTLRPVLLYMKAKIKIGLIDTLIVNSSDRIVRAPFELFEFYEEMKQANPNFKILSVSEGKLDQILHLPTTLMQAVEQYKGEEHPSLNLDM